MRRRPHGQLLRVGAARRGAGRGRAAKGLANGLPVGAPLVADAAPDGSSPETTEHVRRQRRRVRRGGAVVETLDEALLASVRERARRRGRAVRLPGVVEVRGRGLMLGAELDRPAGLVVAAALEAGLLVGSAGRDRPAPDAAADDRGDEVAAGLSLLEEVLT